MPILRPCSTALAGALPNGLNAPKAKADLFTFVLSDGVTTFNWTDWTSDLVIGGVTYSSQSPWLKRGKWSLSNTMEVPSLEVDLYALNTGFNGGAQIKTQIHNGLFDGATFTLARVFMPTPGDVTTLGAITLWQNAVVAGVDVIGTGATITIKGKNNRLDQYAPRNIYQIGCNHAFCDAGCTLSRASFTANFIVGAGATSTFVPWAAAPGSPTNYNSGTLTLTTGVGAGQSRTIVEATSVGLTLAYPLYILPNAGDQFSAFQGCDKTFDSGSGQSCTDRSNTQNYRGYDAVPPPNMAY